MYIINTINPKYGTHLSTFSDEFTQQRIKAHYTPLSSAFDDRLKGMP